MKTRSKAMIFILIFVLFFSLSSIEKRIYGNTENEKLAVTLIIDTSGSMKNTDPENMREMASNIFIDLLSTEDSLGIISFNSEVTEIQPMTKIGQSKRVMKDNLSGKLSGDGDTDYLKAFQSGQSQLSEIQEKTTKKVIIFITDGNPDPEPNKNNQEGFLGSYMEEFWETIRTLGEKEYPVYTVGIGALDLEVIDRIALETKGKSSVFSDASEMAKELFHILAELKNREVFLGQEMDVQGDVMIPFDLEGNTLQTTFVITHDLDEISVSLETSDEKIGDALVHLENNEKYTLVTIDELDLHQHDKWVLRLNGNGQVEVFGARDHTVKVWLDSPLGSYRYPTGEPIEVKAGITGADLKEVTIDAAISFQGKEKERMTLHQEDDEFTGEFIDTHVPGEYQLTLRILKENKEISRSTSEFTLKNLPVMNPDFQSDNLKVNLGGSKVITSTLEIGANNLSHSEDFSLEFFNLIGEMNGEKILFPMVDDGNVDFGDAKSGDGRFSTQVNFEKTGKMELLLEARGYYQGELFILEKSMGEVNIYSPGGVSVEILSDTLSGMNGKEMTLNLLLKNDSHFEEVIQLGISEELGVLFPSEILLDALEEKKISVTFFPNKDMNFREFPLTLGISMRNENTKLSLNNTEVSVTTISQASKVMSFIESYGREIIISISLALLLLLLYVIIGLILYQVFVRKRSYLQGKLFFTYDGSDQTVEVDLKRLRKSKIILSLHDEGEHESEVDVHLNQSRYRYKMILENHMNNGKSKIFSGYGCLFKRFESEFFVRTTEPGIILIDNQIHTRIKLNHQTEFKSGDYSFRFEYNGHKEMKTKHEGKNMLEGRL